MSRAVFPPQCNIIPVVLAMILLNCLTKPNLATCNLQLFTFVTLQFFCTKKFRLSGS